MYEYRYAFELVSFRCMCVSFFARLVFIYYVVHAFLIVFLARLYLSG